MRLFFNFPDTTLPLFVDSIGYDWLQHTVNRPHGYPFYHWLQCDSGHGRIQILNSNIELQPGQGILIAANIPHSYQPITSNWKTSYFTFGGALIREITASLGFHEQLYLQNPGTDITDFTYESFLDFSKITENLNARDSLAIYNFLLLLRPFMITETPRSNTQQIAKKVSTLIKNHYQDDLKNIDFATSCNYSVQYILRTFQKVYQTTPHQYLTAYRIQKVKEILITHPNISLADAAYAVGFSNENYLIHVFKQYEGITPGKFRAMYE
ncbi:AraC family transcriptional regulator [Latilactobacillus sakei]|uniref:AraC family transcriptional regulator n=1 Tax=Latilactobacillus sakei TaxID=1599 RepID=UPI003F538E22